MAMRCSHVLTLMVALGLVVCNGSFRLKRNAGDLQHVADGIEVHEAQDEEGYHNTDTDMESQDEYEDEGTVMLQTDANSSSHVAAIPLKLEDCGDSKTLGRSTSLRPSTLKKGVNNKMTSRGTLRKTVPGGTFDMKVKMTSFPYSTLGNFKGKDICKDHTLKLKSGFISGGTITWKGLDCPVKKGKITTITYMKLPSMVPSSFVKSKTSIRAKYGKTKLLCNNIVSGR